MEGLILLLALSVGVGVFWSGDLGGVIGKEVDVDWTVALYDDFLADVVFGLSHVHESLSVIGELHAHLDRLTSLHHFRFADFRFDLV